MYEECLFDINIIFYLFSFFPSEPCYRCGKDIDLIDIDICTYYTSKQEEVYCCTHCYTHLASLTATTK